MDADDLAFAGVARQADLIREGAVSPREVVEAHLARIERIEPWLNAFRTVYAERALEEADALEGRRGERGPLHGVPIAVKDNMDVAGDVTTSGTDAYGPPASADGEVVRRLRAAGAIVIGKTHMPELAIFPITQSVTWGVTRNPWNRHRSTGGSSGGSGAAAGAALAAAALGSDGGGSVRIPAASCGLFGLKPQRGRISLMPDGEHWYGLSVIGPLARTPLDAALLFDAVAGNMEGDVHVPPALERPLAEAAAAAPGRLRVAVSVKPPYPVPMDERVRGAVRATAEALRSLGHDVRERDPDYGPPGALQALFVPRWARGSRDDAARLPAPERLERRTRAVVRLGSIIPDAAVARARAAELGFARRLNSVFDEHDVLLTPVIPRPPLALRSWEGRSGPATIFQASNTVPFTTPWNVTGQPAASLPAGSTEDGLPLGVQLVGRANDEATLVSLAAQLEAETRTAERRPPLP